MHSLGNLIPILCLLSAFALVLCHGSSNIYELLEDDPTTLLSKDFKHRMRRTTTIDVKDGGEKINQTYAGKKENDQNTNTTINKDTIDDHRYYTSKFTTRGESYFIDLSNGAESLPYDEFEIEKHELLSKAYLKAAVAFLKFPFYFYGNKVQRVVVTTGGFLSVGPIFHAYAHIVHYIAPLMANFNPSIDNTTEILVGSGKDIFIVQWKNMQMNNTANGGPKFDFQTILHGNGTIVFAYKDVPVSPIKLPNDTHNVTIGIADGLVLSYIYHKDGKIHFHNYIYSYHRVSLPLQNPIPGSAFILDLEPTCIRQTTCDSCLNKNNTRFSCKWCPLLQRCSNGLDWHRQSWMIKCGKTAFDDPAKCSAQVPDKGTKTMTKKKDSSSNNGALIGGIVGFLILVVLIILLAMFYYAYTHPQSSSGMWLIEHRPAVLFSKTRFNKVPEDNLL